MKATPNRLLLNRRIPHFSCQRHLAGVRFQECLPVRRLWCRHGARSSLQQAPPRRDRLADRRRHPRRAPHRQRPLRRSPRVLPPRHGQRSARGVAPREGTARQDVPGITRQRQDHLQATLGEMKVTGERPKSHHSGDQGRRSAGSQCRSSRDQSTRTRTSTNISPAICTATATQST